MIITIWQYDSALEGVASPRLKQSLAGSTALSRARYIFGIQLDENDLAVMEQVKPVGDYIDSDRQDGDRIEGRYAYNLMSDDPEKRAEEFAIYSARAGLKRFWHLVVSSREDEELSEEQLEHVRGVVLRVLGVARCPSIWATHGDTDNRHMHGLAVSFLPAEDIGVTFGQEWWKEASQIAMALVERDLALEPEPNRRFVADHTGVYHTFSDIKVADAEGNILGREPIVAMQKADKAWKRHNAAPSREQARAEWDLGRALKVLAEPRIKNALTAEDMHLSLARVGFRYVADDNGARVIANGYNPGPGADVHGQSIAAGKVYSNAALGKLSTRFKKYGGYKPADPDLHVRPFVMPRFSRLEEDERRRYAERRAEIEECDALIDHLEVDNGRLYRKLRDTQTGSAVNAERQINKQAHVDELAVAKQLKGRLANGFDARAARTRGESSVGEQDTLAVLWGSPAGKPKEAKARLETDEREELRRRYEIEEGARQRIYRLNEQIAFIERLRTIQIVSRERRVRIDAVKLARRRFRQLRITARHRVRAQLGKIAAELGIRLKDGWIYNIARAHAEAVAAGRQRSFLQASRLYHETREERDRARYMNVSAQRTRQKRIARFHERGNAMQIKALVGQYLAQPLRSVRGGDDPQLQEARRKLAMQIDQDTLWLSSSRYRESFAGRTYRFLDDPALLKAFAAAPEVLVDPEVQLTLAKIEADQLAKRRWVAAALVAGEAALEGGELRVKGSNQHPAAAFWNAQRADPAFARLIWVARARPDRFSFDLQSWPSGTSHAAEQSVVAKHLPPVYESAASLQSAAAGKSAHVERSTADVTGEAQVKSQPRSSNRRLSPDPGLDGFER